MSVSMPAVLLAVLCMAGFMFEESQGFCCEKKRFAAYCNPEKLMYGGVHTAKNTTQKIVTKRGAFLTAFVWVDAWTMDGRMRR